MRRQMVMAGVVAALAGCSAAHPLDPAAGPCVTRGTGVFALPDAHCTPGELNPAVTQASIDRTICVRGWTRTVRPPGSVTGPMKRASMRQYGINGSPARWEYDHLLPLELGGAPASSQNLWPELNARSGSYRNPKDRLEDRLRELVCSRRMTLADAQLAIVTDWASAYKKYVR